MFRVWSPRRGIAVSPLADFTPSPNTRKPGSTKTRCRLDTEIPYPLFSLILWSGESVEVGGIQTVNTEFPYQVPIVDRGTIAVPLFADPVSDS